MKLHVIGNGFDLYHGLPSSYFYFGCYLAKYDPKFYKEMGEMYGFTCFKEEGVYEYEMYVEDIFWREFEVNLGKLNSTWIEGSLADELGLECDDPIDVYIPEKANSKTIKAKFVEWIENTVNTRNNYQIIKKEMEGNKCIFGKQDFFINFNYTQTLREIYGVSECQEYHIHGKCTFDGADSKIVLGHYNVREIDELDRLISESEKSMHYLVSQAARNRMQEYKAERSLLYDLKKDVDLYLEFLKRIIETKMVEAEEILVWGCSCGEVDMPYIEYLNAKFPDAKWKMSYFDEEEKLERRKLASELGVPSRCELFEFKNPDCKKIMKQIIELNDIETF